MIYAAVKRCDTYHFLIHTTIQYDIGLFLKKSKVFEVTLVPIIHFYDFE